MHSGARTSAATTSTARGTRAADVSGTPLWCYCHRRTSVRIMVRSQQLIGLCAVHHGVVPRRAPDLKQNRAIGMAGTAWYRLATRSTLVWTHTDPDRKTTPLKPCAHCQSTCSVCGACVCVVRACMRARARVRMCAQAGCALLALRQG